MPQNVHQRHFIFLLCQIYYYSFSNAVDATILDGLRGGAYGADWHGKRKLSNSNGRFAPTRLITLESLEGLGEEY
jgi:hypothetical protein